MGSEFMYSVGGFIFNDRNVFADPCGLIAKSYFNGINYFILNVLKKF